MDRHVCMNSLDYMVRSGHVCYHDRGQHLRRDDHRRQGIAVSEGIVRYGHQGGGQTGQSSLEENHTREEKEE